jgi:hypothetical protein
MKKMMVFAATIPAALKRAIRCGLKFGLNAAVIRMGK